jgi:hypothetical protein
MQFTDITKAVLSINPDAKVAIRKSNDLDNFQIEYFEGTKEIPRDDIIKKVKELEAEYDANEYQRDRAVAYPSIEDQLDKLYHEGLDAWKALVKQTKDKFPKP